ncbi:MAG: T9SS type A sorting domain-containing protein [Bacteroidota bacterium]
MKYIKESNNKFILSGGFMRFLKTSFVLVLLTLTGLLTQSAFADNSATLTYPVDVVCVPQSLTFTWVAPDAGGPIDSYGIQVSTTSTFTSPYLVTNVTGLSATSLTYSVTIPKYANPYYWRVSTSFTSGSNIYCTASTFSTITPEPTLVAPANGITCAPIDGQMAWVPPFLASETRFEINTSSTFDAGSLVYDSGPLNSSTFSLTSTTITYNTTYYIRMQSNRYVGDGCWSGWGSSKTFTTIPITPSITSPAHASSCVSQNASFTWTATPPALNYHLKIYNSATEGPANLVYENTALTSNTFNYHLPTSSQQYWVKVRSNYACGYTPWSSSNSFTTQQPVPTPLLPLNGTNSITFSTSLSWTAVSPVSSYHLQVADNPQFTGMDVNVANITSTSYTINLPPTKYNTVFYWRVSSSYTTCESDFSNTFSFKTVFGPVTLGQPINHRTCTPVNYRFTWSAVPTATRYRIQVSPDATFTSLFVNQGDVQDLFFDVQNLAALRTYYWRVRVDEPGNVGEWSAPWDFQSNIPITTLLSPPNNSGGYPLNVPLVWQSVTPGALYNLQVSDTPVFTNKLVDISTSSTTYNVVMPNYNVQYYWRVSATMSPCSSTFSDIWSFRTVLSAPTLVSPANGAIGQPSQIMFNWNTVSGATTYEYQLASSSSFTTILRGIEQSASNYLVSNLTSETNYWWRVRAKNAEGASPWSTVWTFRTHLAGPAIPILLFPGDNAEAVPTALALRWRTSTNALTYHLQVSPNNLFVNNLYDLNTLSSTSYNIGSLENYKTYYWHVSAINDSGETAYSDTWAFRVVDVLPGSPTLLTPANNLDNVDVNIAFAWLPSASQSIVQYKFQLATSNSFTPSSIVVDDDSYNQTNTAQNLNYETDYFWRVRGRNEAGNGNWSQVWQFKTKVFVGVNDGDALLNGISVFPNPFNDRTTIRVNVPVENYLNIRITNSLGAEVKTLGGQNYSAGQHDFLLDASNLPSGIYWYQVQIGTRSFVNRMVIVK